MKTSLLLALAILLTACGKSNSSKTIQTGKRSEELQVSEAVTYSLLEDKREAVTFPEMNSDARKTLLSQSKIILGELYVNRLKKIKTYGAQIDPLIKLERLEKEYMDASTPVFNQELANIYSSQRDHHTWYNAPTPGGCYIAFLPFSVTPAKDVDGNQVSVVRSVRSNANTLELAPEVKKLSKGDVLISINERSTEEEIKSLSAYNSGSNQAAFLRSGHSILTYRNQTAVPLPEENNVRLTLKKQNGDIYSATIPWMIFENKQCLKEGRVDAGKGLNESAENTLITEYEKFYKTPTQVIKRKGSFILSNSIDSKDEGSALVVLQSANTEEPTISWWTFKNAKGTFGVIKLDSFSPEEKSVYESKMIISNLMNNQLASVDGIIFDLRNNGGGTIAYGQGLAELVTAKQIDVLKFQLLNSPATQHYFSAAEPGSPFTKELKKAAEQNATMTAPIALSTAEQLFTDGQAFFRPIAIFTNSNCYSTCDMMSALFQDHALAEVWGEDAQTGAGGANNWNYNYLLRNLPKDNMGPFKKLPFNMNVGFAFRQTVRTGIHAGELLEDEGVFADHIIETTVEDVVNNGKSQFAKISESLAAKKAQYMAEVRFNKQNSLETEGENIELLLDVKATDTIKVFYKKEVIADVKVVHSLETQTVKVSFPVKAFDKNSATIEIKGFSVNKPVWRKVTQVRKVVAPIKLASNDDLLVKIDNNLSPFIVYNKQSDSSLGWYADGQTLRIGSEKGYADDVQSTASLFVDLANKTSASLSFNMEYQTEKDFDFVTVMIVSGSETLEVLSKSSGSQEAKDFQADLSRFKGKKIEIRFSFESDEAANDRGVWVKNIRIN